MKVSKQVEDSVSEAISSLRNALAFAARNERPMICREIAKMISQIETIQHADGILDTLENREHGSRGSFGSHFDPNPNDEE